MSYNNQYHFSSDDSLWGYTDILETDIEQMEFNKNFDVEDIAYASILDDDASFPSLLNFPEDEEDDLYNDNDDDTSSRGQSENDGDFDTRDHYKDAFKEGTSYFI